MPQQPLSQQTRQAIDLYSETGRFLALPPDLPEPIITFYEEQAIRLRATFPYEQMMQWLKEQPEQLQYPEPSLGR